MLILGFHTTDALAVAKHAELQTVGLHEAVFLQGFGVRFRRFPVHLSLPLCIIAPYRFALTEHLPQEKSAMSSILSYKGPLTSR